jgi:hypothetical protein
VHAGHPRAGRRFEPISERELSSDTLLAARGLPNAHRGLRILLETAGPFGVPDLVAVIGPTQALNRRLRLRVPPLLNEVDAGVVAAAAVKAPRTAVTLAARVGWPIETVNRRIPGLLKSGALRAIGTESFVRPAALQPVGRLYAIEAKVRDWRRALRQARTYSIWCDSYVIVMPALGPTSTPNVLGEVRSDGGGLMLDGRWLVRPKLRSKSPSQRLWGSEHAIAAFFT